MKLLSETGTKALVLAVSLRDGKNSSSRSLKGRDLSQVRWAGTRFSQFPGAFVLF